MTRISSEDAVSISPSPAHPLPLDDGLFFSVKRMEVDPALMWTTQSCLDDEGPFIVFNEILCCGLHMMWRARTVYTSFGIPGIPSSIAATEEKARFAFKEYTSEIRIMKPMLGMPSAVVQISAWTLTRGCDELSCARPIWQASTVTINDYVTH